MCLNNWIKGDGKWFPAIANALFGKSVRRAVYDPWFLSTAVPELDMPGIEPTFIWVPTDTKFVRSPYVQAYRQ